MRCFATGLLMLAATGCSAPGGDTRNAEATVASAGVAFDGADYKDQTAKIAHGKRLTTLFSCSGCHGADYSGRDFGVDFPIVQGLWASNDAAFDRLLIESIDRTGKRVTVEWGVDSICHRASAEYTKVVPTADGPVAVIRAGQYWREPSAGPGT